MANTKGSYGAIPVFPGAFNSSLDKVLFAEAYKNQTMFFYTSENARTNDIKRMKARCKKKGITVDFKLINPKIDDMEVSAEVSE